MTAASFECPYLDDYFWQQMNVQIWEIIVQYMFKASIVFIESQTQIIIQWIMLRTFLTLRQTGVCRPTSESIEI